MLKYCLTIAPCHLDQTHSHVMICQHQGVQSRQNTHTFSHKIDYKPHMVASIILWNSSQEQTDCMALMCPLPLLRKISSVSEDSCKLSVLLESIKMVKVDLPCRKKRRSTWQSKKTMADSSNTLLLSVIAVFFCLSWAAKIDSQGQYHSRVCMYKLHVCIWVCIGVRTGEARGGGGGGGPGFFVFLYVS